MPINLDKQDALVDDVINIAVSGLPPNERVTVGVSLTERGHIFGASGCYIADEDGCVNLSRHASTSGTYKGLSAMGLFWSLTSAPGEPEGGRLLKANASSPLVYTLTVYSGHLTFEETFSSRVASQVLCQTSIRRWYMSKGVQKIQVHSVRVRGALFIPAGRGPFSGLIDMFGGGGGGLIECRAALLASRGFTVLALPYSMYDDLPSSLDNLELEYFMEAVDWLSTHPCVKSDKVGVIGVSKGGEIALYMSYYNPKVRAVVSINANPYLTAYPMQYKGEQLERAIVTDGLEMSEKGIVYKNATPFPKEKYLPIWEREDVRVLLIVGEDDMCVDPSVFPSLYQMYPDERKANCQLVVYPGAGHLIEPPYAPLCAFSKVSFGTASTFIMFVWGGNTVQHAAAQEDAWRRVLQHFRSNLDDDQLPNVTNVSCKL